MRASIRMWSGITVLVLWLGALAWGADTKPPGAEPEALKFSFDAASKEEVLRTDMDEAGEGDQEPFNVRTDTNIEGLRVGDQYRNEAKTFYQVSEIKSQGKSGGEFIVKRVKGKDDPGRYYLLAKAAPRAEGELKPPGTIAVRLTLFDLYRMGGDFLHPISLLAITMLVLFANSLWLYRRARQVPPSLVEAGDRFLEQGDVAALEEKALKTKGLLAQVASAMLDRHETSSLGDMRGRAEAIAGVGITRLRIPVKLLNLCAVAAPLLGLLGTIVGMVIVFEAVAGTSGASRVSQLAAGIRVKLFCTAYALMVAIPSLFMFFIFNQRLNVLVAEVDMIAERWLRRIGELRAAKRGDASEEDGLEEDEVEVEAEEAAEPAPVAVHANPAAKPVPAAVPAAKPAAKPAVSAEAKKPLKGVKT